MTDRAITVRLRNIAARPDPDIAPDSDELDSFVTARALWRRRALIICMTIAIMVVMTVVIFMLPPVYTATSYVMIDSGNTKIADAVAAVMVGGSADSATVESEVRVLQSRKLADRVVTKLQLDRDPEFNSALQPPGFLDRYLGPVKAEIGRVARTARQWLEGKPEVAAPPPSEAELLAAKRARIINRFLSHLSASVDGVSRVIAVSASSSSAKTAASIANAVAELYIELQLEAKFEAAKAANQWLNARIDELRDQVQAAESAAEQYRAEHGLIASNDVMLSTQQASDLGAQLAVARSQRAEAEARLRELQNAVGGRDSVSEVLNSGVISALRAQETEVERKVADLAQDHGPNHPELIQARAELAQVKSQIRSEVGKIANALRNEVTAARAREASLEESLDKLKAAAGEQNQVGVKLRALERDAAASRTLLETFLKRAEETNSQEDFQDADAHIISKAAVPGGPTYPKKKVLLLAGLFGALAVSILLAFLLELMSRGFRSEEQVEQLLGAASLGLVPSLRRMRSSRVRPSSYVMKNPASAYVESIRNLYTGLRLSNGEDLPRAILIASSLPQEGKTTVAVSFAALLSASGLRTIIVDTDLRKPAIHRALGIAPGPGLVDYLGGELPLDAVIQHEGKTGIAAIAAGSRTASPPNLLGTERMKELLEDLKAAYDVVILDSAPVLAVSDTRMLVRVVEKTVFLVRWEDTKRGVAGRGLHQILDAGGNVAGIMLTMVDFEKYAKYGYGAFGDYYRRVESYYAA